MTQITWAGLKPFNNAQIVASFASSFQRPLAQFGYFKSPGANMRQIAIKVAEQYGLTLEELRGPGRARHLAWPRQEAMWLMRQVMRNGEPRFSYPQIGEFFGGRDHTTVMHAIWAVNKRMIAVRAA